MPAPESIKQLVAKFAKNIQQYKSGSYNETETRIEFINPFWKELGWDMDNTRGRALAYRDVVHEVSVRLKVGSGKIGNKKPDYAFCIGGTRKFFLEAKKPSVSIKTDASCAYQLRCYGWSGKLALSILTDFEEFAVYDCRKRPNETDRADVARIKYYTYTEYVERWEEIAAIFHRENILNGSFDQFVDSKKSKSGTSEVDEEFLKEIEGWREILAKDIARHNPDLDIHELNFAVQRTIDRLVFLRMAEDRGIEPENQLLHLTTGTEIHKNLLNIYYTADDKYDSGFFHFDDEKGQREEPDRLTPQLIVSDEPLQKILKRLYSSPYKFDVFPVEILGNVYERFLGKVIRLTPSRQIKVEEKPEVRKAGGVFYTPIHVVDYIVHNTVGVKCEGKTPREVSELKFLDPSCGSGSFLLGAYKFLLDWHLRWYIAEHDRTGAVPQSPQGAVDRRKKSDATAIFQSVTGVWKLTLAERKRILLNNIFGVDIDAQAVDVTKLSLCLAVLEDMNRDILETNLRLFHDRALPDLGGNIRCGNSLIASDFYSNQDALFEDAAIRRRINAFDWKKEFPSVFSPFSEKTAETTGFDCVIGNPPYGAAFTAETKEYLASLFPLVPDYESSDFFIDKSRKLLKDNGLLSLIVPNMFLANIQAKKYRLSLLENWQMMQVNHLHGIKVFKDATIRNCIILFKKCNSRCDSVFASVELNEGKLVRNKTKKVSKKQLRDQVDNWLSLIDSDKDALRIAKKIQEAGYPFGDVSEISQGLIPYDKYRGHSEKTIKNRIWHSDHRIDKTYKRELAGKDVNRYLLQWNGTHWISYGDWLAAPRKKEFFTLPRILIREITNPRILAAYTCNEFYNTPSIINCINLKVDIFFALGIINSSLMSFYHKMTSPKANKGLFPKILVNDVRNLPMPTLDLSNKKQKSRHDKIVSLVESMLSAQDRLQSASDADRKTCVQRIEIIDAQIDAIVYELYGLTNEEVEIVVKD